MKLTVISHEGEWEALYVDGKLDKVGDAYLIDERVRQLAGVEEIHGDFLMGGNFREDCAQTLEEWNQWKQAREEEFAERRLKSIEAEAAKLEAEAAALRETLKG